MKLSITKQAECSPAASSATAPLHVLKFGSSVLRTAADLPIVAGELYRQRRAGRRIVAVVSALAGETDRLLAQAAGVTGPVDCAGIPDLVSLGEERTAALLRLADHLDRRIRVLSRRACRAHLDQADAEFRAAVHSFNPHPASSASSLPCSSSA